MVQTVYVLSAELSSLSYSIWPILQNNSMEHKVFRTFVITLFWPQNLKSFDTEVFGPLDGSFKDSFCCHMFCLFVSLFKLFSCYLCSLLGCFHVIYVYLLVVFMLFMYTYWLFSCYLCLLIGCFPVIYVHLLVVFMLFMSTYWLFSRYLYPLLLLSGEYCELCPGLGRGLWGKSGTQRLPRSLFISCND